MIGNAEFWEEIIGRLMNGTLKTPGKVQPLVSQYFYAKLKGLFISRHGSSIRSKNSQLPFQIIAYITRTARCWVPDEHQTFMNAKPLCYGFLVSACISLSSATNANAQGTVYLNHLGSSADTGLGIGSNFWWAISFETGTTTAGYSLNSIQLRIAGVGGTPSGFDVSLYNNNGGQPGNSLQLLSGPVPASAGIYTFGASAVSLSPSTVYWVVAASPDSTLSGNTEYWAFDPNNYTSTDGWSMSMTQGNGESSYDSGSSWVSAGGSPLTLAVDATAVPEPSCLTLIGGGYGCNSIEIQEGFRLNLRANVVGIWGARSSKIRERRNYAPFWRAF